MIFFILTCLGTSFVVSCGMTALIRRLAPGWGLMDQPAARKVHLTPTPLGGGIGIWFGIVVPLLVAQLVAWLAVNQQVHFPWIPDAMLPRLRGVLMQSHQVWSIVAAGTILVCMGLLDDLRNLPWQPRLLIQMLVSCGLIYGGVRASIFVQYPWVGAIVTFGWIMMLINSFNFLDNMDALSGGIALIASTIFAIIMLAFLEEPRWLVGGFLLILSGSLSGFLVHNRPPAWIFMGDTGSYLIGLCLATMTILGTFYDPNASGKHVILAPLCVLAVPLYDFCTVLVIRLWEGRSPFHADKSHFSHRLVQLGLSKPAAVATIHLTTLMTGLGGLLLYRVQNWSDAALIMLLIVCVLGVIAILETAGRLRKNGP